MNSPAHPSQQAPENGSSDRYLVQLTLHYLASEVQASYGPLFSSLSGDVNEVQLKKVATKLEYVTKHLRKGQGNHYSVGDQFSIADKYLYIILSWSGYVGVDLAAFPALQAYSGFIE